MVVSTAVDVHEDQVGELVPRLAIWSEFVDELHVQSHDG